MIANNLFLTVLKSCRTSSAREGGLIRLIPLQNPIFSHFLRNNLYNLFT